MFLAYTDLCNTEKRSEREPFARATRGIDVHAGLKVITLVEMHINRSLMLLDRLDPENLFS